MNTTTIGIPDGMPLRMHIHQVGLDGAPAMAPAFERYLERVCSQANMRTWERWWENDYVTERLTKRFSADIVQACIILETQVGKAHDVAPRFKGMSVVKLERAERRVNRAIRRDYLPYRHKPRGR